MSQDLSSLKGNGFLKKENLLILATFSLGMIFLGIGLIQLLIHKDPSIKIESTSNQSLDVKGVSDKSSTSSKIKVDVEGEVENPGVYELASDQRISDAIEKAGGLSANADREYVAKGVNLAQKLSDGVKIYIPSIDEKVGIGGVSVGAASMVSNNPGSVNINTASQSELEALPSIGPVTAGKIISGRPYADINDLLTKKIVGQSVFGKIKDLISVY